MAGLYGLYGLAELAIIATDLAELLGSAIALNLWVHSKVGESALKPICSCHLGSSHNCRYTREVSRFLPTSAILRRLTPFYRCSLDNSR